MVAGLREIFQPPLQLGMAMQPDAVQHAWSGNDMCQYLSHVLRGDGDAFPFLSPFLAGPNVNIFLSARTAI